MAWQESLPPTAFTMPLGESQQQQDDWEDWLRWDPTADAASPENAFSHSGSSKNDSPVQAPVFPISHTALNKLESNDTLAPPLVVGEDGFNFDSENILGNDVFAFGLHDGQAANFDFDTTPQDPPIVRSNAASLNTADAHWQATSSGPATATTPSYHHSPESSLGKRTSLSSHPSPEPPKKRGGRKRKIEVEVDPEIENGDSPDGDEPPVKKTSHNVIEKRYRNNLNDKIVELRNSVPSLRAMGRATKGQNTEDLEGLTAAHKHNKATIMAKATEYIRHLERRNKNISDEMTALKARLASIEAAFSKARNRQGSIPGSPRSSTIRPGELTSPSQFLNVPPAQTAFTPQQYMQQHTPPNYARPPNPPAEAQNQHQPPRSSGGLANRVMLGGMAGLMVLEGLGENQAGNDGSVLGLGAVPGLHLFTRGSPAPLLSSSTLTGLSALSAFKVALVICALFYLILPLLTFTPRRKQSPTRQAIRLPQVPSLASPVEVRRNAWLTAIQSVWVPKHFLLEVVAVLSKMVKLSVRRLIGTELFASLTGANKEEEAARIKAWDIAMDAQLAGGDAEVSYYRLLLTLMASGTLPDSPARLMQKAVHFRLFFWEVANAGYGNLIMFKQFTEKVGKFYWESARRLQKELANSETRVGPHEGGVDLLPDHLSSLLALDCDEVLSDEMIQRAWNLAWNKPSAYGTTSNAARDSVIEDHAIRSPLDAVAAWYSNMLVDETIAETLASTGSKIDMEYHLALAVSVAPPASATHSRALAAKAVLSRSNRDTNIIAALDALPAMPPSSPGVNLVNHGPVSPEVCTALTLAKMMSLLSTTTNAASEARLSVGVALSRTSIPPQSFTLLTAVAAYQLLQSLGTARGLPFSASQSLEDLACGLRIWVGTSAGRQAGLDGHERAALVESCLEVARRSGGWDERDSGYGSTFTSKETTPVREVSGFQSLIGA